LTLVAVGSSTSTHVVSRVRCFAERGHTVFLVCEKRVGIPGVTEILPDAVPEAEWDTWYRLVHWIVTRVLKKRANTLGLIYGAARMMKSQRPDIVHVHYAYSGWGWLAAFVDHHPLVVSVMGGDILFEEQGSPSPRGKWLTLNLLRCADLVTSKSNRLTEELARLGGFHRKTVKIVWGVDLKRFRPLDPRDLRRRYGIPDGARIILSPKILQPFYNVDRIVEAMPEILSRHSATRLVITEYLADPAYREHIARRVEALGIDKQVLFVGAVVHADMPAFYSMATVTVSVPSSDGLPQTLLEGMACGVPNVLARLPIYQEFVTHRDTAYFVDPTPQGIAAGVSELLDDAVLRQRIAQNGRAYVESHADFDREVMRMEEAYYTLLARMPRRRGALFRARSAIELLLYFAGRLG